METKGVVLCEENTEDLDINHDIFRDTVDVMPPPVNEDPEIINIDNDNENADDNPIPMEPITVVIPLLDDDTYQPAPASVRRSECTPDPRYMLQSIDEGYGFSTLGKTTRGNTKVRRVTAIEQISRSEIKK